MVRFIDSPCATLPSRADPGDDEPKRASYHVQVPTFPEVVRNPLACLARRYQPSRETVTRAALAALVMNVVIVVTGGAVRLSGSGLGCPTWPKCTGASLTATREMGLHGDVEFGNRMLTYVLCAAVGAAIVTARARAPWRRSLTRLAWGQFWLVVGNAVLGGITVLTGLNPYTVSAHFLLTIALITVAILLWQRSREGDGPAKELVGRPVRQLAWGLAAAAAALIAAGTVVTGAGPHAGDSSEVPRIGLAWAKAAQLHADFAFIVLGLTVALVFVLRAVNAPRAPRQRTRDLLILLLAQGAVGYVQYFTDLPEVIVGVHMLGSALVWIAVLRVLLALRERPYLEPAMPRPQPAAPEPAVA